MSIAVHFFAGFRAALGDIAAWSKSAAAQRPDVEFKGYAWPVAASAGNPLAQWRLSDGDLRKLAADPRQKIIVGHSSGAAYANNVAQRLLADGVANWQLVVLDGFRPDIHLLEHAGTQCWSAECGDVRSLNYYALNTAPHFQAYQAMGCKSTWALHFSLVNRAASDDRVKNIATGYADCIANLIWLDQPSPSEISS